jgi:hypothetical protein
MVGSYCGPLVSEFVLYAQLCLLTILLRNGLPEAFLYPTSKTSGTVSIPEVLPSLGRAGETLRKFIFLTCF